MKHLTQVEKIIEFLEKAPNVRYSAKEIAEAIISSYPEDYKEKRNNPKFVDDKSFISQIVAEIGSQKDRLVKKNNHIFWQDKPRPRVFWFNPDETEETTQIINSENELEDENNDITSTTISTKSTFAEHDLYPLLINYLNTEHNLYCMRIDEKTSKNSRGPKGNIWLHPDVVAMQAVDKGWDNLVRTCVQNGEGQSVKLWSFEVKITLSSSNIRKDFFQTVSNSSWANEGYLVATSISNNKVEQELRMLSALHGIGVILLNPENPSESEIFLPAKTRPEIDWQSVNRILVENPDFKDYIELVSTYYQTGRVRKKDWDK